MSDNDNDQNPEDISGERTSAFRADFSTDQGAVGTAGAEGEVFGVEGLPQGSALLVVKRGPNAGARFLLDQATTTAGRHPNSDVFLDDITVSRRHAQFRCASSEFQVVDVGSLNGTYVNREAVDSAVLANGDEVQIGKFRLVFLTGPTTGDTESVTTAFETGHPGGFSERHRGLTPSRRGSSARVFPEDWTRIETERWQTGVRQPESSRSQAWDWHTGVR